MRFRITLRIDREQFGDIMPINYQYELSAWIYKTLAKSDASYSTWLHDNGYTYTDAKVFKFFCFSQLHFYGFEILQQEERIKVVGDLVDWYVSFMPEKGTETFVKGLFGNNTIIIGDAKSKVAFKIINVEGQYPIRYYDKMTFETMSPVCMKRMMPDGRVKYISPKEDDYKDLVLQNLISKYTTFYGKEYYSEYNDFVFEPDLNRVKSSLITIKADTPQQTKVKGFKFRFTVTGDPKLMKFIYEGGLGMSNSIGFGFVKEIVNL